MKKIITLLFGLLLSYNLFADISYMYCAQNITCSTDSFSSCSGLYPWEGLVQKPIHLKGGYGLWAVTDYYGKGARCWYEGNNHKSLIVYDITHQLVKASEKSGTNWSDGGCMAHNSNYLFTTECPFKFVVK